MILNLQLLLLVACIGTCSSSGAAAAAAVAGDPWRHVPSHKPLDPRVREQTLKRYAPVIYLHPEEVYLPADPRAAYREYYNATLDTLCVPAASLVGLPLVNGQVRAPVTAQARVLADGRVALQYWFYHHRNGAQGFRTQTRDGQITRFSWNPLAVHNADWEHTTILLSGDHVDQVYYTVHGLIHKPHSHFPSEGDRVVVYSHNNSHAGYSTPADVQNTDPAFDGIVNRIVRTITLNAITSIEIDDIGFDYLPVEDHVRWSHYEIYDMTEAHEGYAPEWFNWTGNWGPPFDQSLVDMPPEGVPSRRLFYILLQLFYHAGRLSQFIVSRKLGPKGPAMHYTWRTLDVYEPPWGWTVPNPDEHKPSILVIGLFAFFILGFVGIIVVLVCLLCIVGICVKGAIKRTMDNYCFVSRHGHSTGSSMSERTQLLGDVV